MENYKIEEEIIQKFIVKEKRDRLIWELSNSKKRNTVFWHFAGPKYFKQECLQSVAYMSENTMMSYLLKFRETKNVYFIGENYRQSSKFRSSGSDGFMEEYVSLTADRLVRIPDDINLEVASFIELISVSVHAISRFMEFSHNRRNSIAVWGRKSVNLKPDQYKLSSCRNIEKKIKTVFWAWLTSSYGLMYM